MFKENLLNDNELVQQFIAGDQNSLEILICRHKSRVFSYILLIVKSKELAEDIFQETFIKVIRSLKRGKYIENGKFVSWVLRISHNLIIDHFRKEKLRGTISNDNSNVDIFNSLPVGIYRTRIDDGTFLKANPECAKMLGYENSDQLFAA